MASGRSLAVPDPGLLTKIQEHLKDSSNWRLASLLDLKIVCQDGILFWNTLLIASLSPMLNALLEVDEPCLVLPDQTVATLRSLLNSLLTQGGVNLGIEEQQVLRTWAVEQRFWRRKEEATIQIVGRRDIEIEEEVEVKVEGKRERHQVEARTENEAEEDVAIIWRQEEKEETKPRAVVTSVSNTGRKMLCKVCDISFQGRPYSDYQDHIQTHRDKGGQFSCTDPGCGKVFKAWCHLNDHVYTHGKLAKPHSCPHCPYTSTTKANIRKHVIGRHEDPERRDFPCNKCSKKFKTSSNLMEHLKVHEPGYRHTCQVCSKQFRSQVGFQQHQRTHTGDLFPCNVCGEKFQSKHSASRHEKDLHGVFGQSKDDQEKVWRCGVVSCGAEFTGEEEQRLHARTAHQSRNSVLICKMCRKICTNRAALRSHMQKQHPGSSTGSRQKPKLERKVSLLKGESEAVTSGGAAPNRCICCGRKWRHRYQLLSHLAVKQGRLSCQVGGCAEASTVFPSKELLELHLQAHTGESCHPCSHCPRVFPTAGRRSRHEATHDGEEGEELPCPHCGEQQPSRLVLNMHTRYCRARDGEYTVVVEEERVELGAESMVLTLEKDDLLVYQMNQQ